MCEAPTPGGFPCPRCGSRSEVMDSRARVGGWRRRRRCTSCRHRFSTIELVYTNDLTAALAFKRRVVPKLEELMRWIASLESEPPEEDDVF